MAAAKGFFLLLALLLIPIVTATPQAQDHGYPDIEQQQLERRTVIASTSNHASTSGHLSSVPSSTFSHPVLTIITIRAMPIRITKQMQYVTSYKPIITLCPLAGLPLPSQPSFPASGLPTASAHGANASLPSSGVLPRGTDLAARVVLPRDIADVSTCSVFWEPITTPIYHTTLSPLAAPLITVTECHQSVTFSSQLGYALASTISPSTVETLMTYYVAPWSDLSTGLVPTKSVIAVICSSGRTDCTTGKEKWDTQLSEYTHVTKTTVSVHTTVVGPATVIIDPAIEAITIGGGDPGTVSYIAVLETTLTSTTTAIIKATASSLADAATTGVARAESNSLDLADDEVKVSSTTVTMFFASCETCST